MKHILRIALGAVLFLAACNSNQEAEQAAAAGVPAGTPKETAAEAAPETNTPAAQQQQRASIRLELSGGESAGTYEAVCKDGGCSHGLAGEDKFGLQYSETGKAETELSSVQMIVPEVRGNTKTDEFMLTISFGELFEGKSYTINTLKSSANPKGSGTMEIKFSGSTALVRMQGKTEEGYPVALTLECQKVLTAENMMEELSGK